jgi:hypothetical protein
VEAVFKRHSTPLKQNFESLMAIAEALMQSTEPDEV